MHHAIDYHYIYKCKFIKLLFEQKNKIDIDIKNSRNHNALYYVFQNYNYSTDIIRLNTWNNKNYIKVLLDNGLQFDTITDLNVPNIIFQTGNIKLIKDILQYIDKDFDTSKLLGINMAQSEILFKKTILYNLRIPIIKLVNGIDTSNYYTHIMKYMFNENITKEICSFIL